MSDKKITASEAKKQSIIKVFNDDTQRYTNVIIPSKLSVGLNSPDFNSGLSLHGPIEFKEIVAPSSTDLKLYVVGSSLYFNGSEVSSGAGGSTSTVGWIAPAANKIATTGSLAVGMSTAGSDPVHIKESQVSSGVSNSILRLEHYSSDGFADGDGPGIKFTGGDAASENNALGRIAVTRNGSDTEGDMLFMAGTSGAEQFITIKSTGKVGIGTTLPEDILHIQSAATTTRLQIENTAANGDPILMLQTDGATNWYMGIDDSDSDKLMFMSDGGAWDPTSAEVTFATDGKVGIGTTDPVTTLEVGKGYGGASSIEGISIVNTSGKDTAIDLIEETEASSGFGTTGAYGFRLIYDGGTNKLYLKSGEAGSVTTACTWSRSSGVLQAKKDHIYPFAYYGGSPNIKYPSWYSFDEATDINSTTTGTQALLLAPYDGSFKSVTILTRASMADPAGTTDIAVHKNASSTALDTQTVDIAALNTVYTVSFTQTFVAGDLLSISINPTGGGAMAYCVGTLKVTYDEQT